MIRSALTEDDRVAVPEITREGQYGPAITKWRAMGVRCSSCLHASDVSIDGATGRCAKAQQALLQRYGWGERKVQTSEGARYEKTGKSKRRAKVFDIKDATACCAWEPSD